MEHVGPARLLCVSLHDVAPTTVAACRSTLEFLDGLGIGPVSLLVVPDYHGHGRIDRDPGFCAFLRAREDRGDEIVLHGFWHRDTATPCRNLREWVERRVLTNGEGEFSRLDTVAARNRLLRGLAVLRAAGWQPRGFVAPAWLMSPGTHDALESLPLQYCATRDFIVPLHGGETIRAPSLVVSTGSSWRRLLSPAWNRARLARWHEQPVLRAALPPGDVDHASSAALWRALLRRLADREVTTEGRLVPGHAPRADLSTV
jgi:predicted deacetylase